MPCYNEEAAIATVVRDFKAALPDATIYVYDNNSKDQTMARAAEAGRGGARRKPARAKGMSCGACLPMSTQISICWSMATTPMTRTPRRAQQLSADDRRSG